METIPFTVTSKRIKCPGINLPRAQTVKNLPAMRETQVLSPGWEDPLEKGMQPTPVFLPGESRGQRSLRDRLPPGLQRVGHD